MARDDKRLLDLFSRLGDEERRTLLDFAAFLAERCEPPPLEPPRPIPRPEKETVIGAIKRLSETYPMVDKSKVLHETSTLMSQHLIHGRAAVEVIDELEIVFRTQYECLTNHQKD